VAFSGKYRLFFLCVWLYLPAKAKCDALTPEAIIDRLIANGTNAATARRFSYSFIRSIRTEVLDEKEQSQDHGTRVYDLEPEKDHWSPVLIEVNQKTPTAQEKAEWSKRAVEAEKHRETPLNRELLNHYTFTLAGEEALGKRPAYILSFQPRVAVKDSDGILDRFLGHMSGRIWVDKDDFQLSKLDIHLTKRMTFLLGVAGVLDKFNLLLERTRLEPGVWLTRGSYIEFKGRKLFSSFHFRSWEDCHDFKLSQKGPVEAKSP
jgi:hypothetical protein